MNGLKSPPQLSRCNPGSGHDLIFVDAGKPSVLHDNALLLN
jgi:hypothetical protein